MPCALTAVSRQGNAPGNLKLCPAALQGPSAAFWWPSLSAVKTPSRGFQARAMGRFQRNSGESQDPIAKRVLEALGLAVSNRIDSMADASRFTLHASRFTLHASRFIKGFRPAALIGVASLSLAACGGGAGDSTVQTAPVKRPHRLPPTDETPELHGRSPACRLPRS